MRSRPVAVAVVVLALLGAGCSKDGDAKTGPKEPAPLPGGETTKPTAPAAIDVSVIPEKIDEAYINAVLAGLNEVDGKATQIIVQNKRVVPEALEHLSSIYGEAELQEQIEIWLTQINKGLERFKENGVPTKSTVLRTMSASPACLSLEVEEDVSGHVMNPGQFTKQFLQLVPLDQSRNRKGLNPTAWMIQQAGLRSDGSDPGDLCVG